MPDSGDDRDFWSVVRRFPGTNRPVSAGHSKLRVEKFMTRIAAALLAGLAVFAAQPARSQIPTFTTTKVDGTDGVYIFRYQGHQSMFIVTPQGVIATDPIGERRPEAVTTYIAEIRKITQAPIKYVIYSHSHYDHIAGGKPFKDLGAVFVAHKNAKAVLLQRRNPDIVIPDDTVDAKKEIKLGGTTLELLYVGKNHSDNSLVMRLPKEKIIFVVDFIPLQGVQFRVMYDNYLPDLETSIEKILAMDWERIIPGHPGPGGRQIGTKDDARIDLDYLRDLSAAAKQAADQGKCFDAAEKEIRLPKYEKLAGYEAFLPYNIERYCDYWNRGI
jgi:glyoxylase-like metal-dependent hydrolase (beta-lactamase superfamily II)